LQVLSRNAVFKSNTIVRTHALPCKAAGEA
jgi:hypothetical protein